MSLGDHLRELRGRIVKSALAIALGGVVGWFAYDRIFKILEQPLLDARDKRHNGGLVTLNFPGITDTFSLKVQVSLVVGLLIASPVWLYQFWAFVTPGLRRKERRYAVGFLAAAVPMFLGGAALALVVLPKAAEFLLNFTPTDGSNIIDVTGYFGFVIRLVVAFGIAFLVPVLLVGLNFAGILSAHRLIRSWRIGTFLIFVFAAAATPTPDAWTMLLLAGFILALCAVAVAIAWIHDRRKAAREVSFAGLSDDETSPLDHTPAPIDDDEPL